MDIVIRQARMEDAEPIARVQVETWRDAYRDIVDGAHLAHMSVGEQTGKWREWLRSDSRHRPIFVGDELGEVVGFISGGRSRQARFPFDAELYALYVKPPRQRRNVGRSLTRALVDALRDQGYRSLLVGVFEQNASARRFYETLGGAYVGEQPLSWGGASYPEVFYGWPELEDVTT